MIKRCFDIIISSLGLIFFSPILIFVMLMIWISDKKSPIYITERLGRGEIIFKMVKLRTMMVDADKSGVFSSSNNDLRITPVGHKIRKYKLDEIMQLWNVLLGDMSLVGPRPNVKDETDLYTIVEKELLSVKPGITDFASIVFSDEGVILNGKKNPDLVYNQLIRPWKSRLGLIYIKNQSFLIDIKLMFYTLVGLFFRKKSLNWVSKQLSYMNVDKTIIKISSREIELYPFPPPGMDEVVTER